MQEMELIVWDLRLCKQLFDLVRRGLETLVGGRRINLQAVLVVAGRDGSVLFGNASVLRSEQQSCEGCNK